LPALLPLKPSAFLETIIAALLPYMTAADMADARAEIIDTIAAYATRNRAEMLQAAQIIAFGMTTLDVLAEAKAAETPMSHRIRCRSCANSLNRSALNTEKALDRRLSAPSVSAADDLAAPIKQAAPAPQTTHPITIQDRNRHLWAGAMMDTLRQMGMPNGSEWDRPPA
jgi:hypothetical protein